MQHPGMHEQFDSRPELTLPPLDFSMRGHFPNDSKCSNPKCFFFCMMLCLAPHDPHGQRHRPDHQQDAH